MQPLAALQRLLHAQRGPVLASASARTRGVALTTTSDTGDDAGTLAAWHPCAAAFAHTSTDLPWCVVDAAFVFSDTGRAALADPALHGGVIALLPGAAAGDLGPLALLEAHPHVQLFTPGRATELPALMDAAAHQPAGVTCIVLPCAWEEQAVEPPLHADQQADALRGLYLLQPGGPQATRVQLLGCGAALGPVLQAAATLARHGVAADVWSITSPSALVQDGRAAETAWREDDVAATSHLAARLAATTGPLIAATPWARALPELLRAFVPAQRRYLSLALSTAPDAGDLVTRAALQLLGDAGRAQAHAELQRLDDLAHLAVT